MDDDDFLHVEHSGSALIAWRPQVWKIEVRCEWNPDTLACDLVLDGEPRSLDYISQRILGDFFFEDLPG